MLTDKKQTRLRCTVPVSVMLDAPHSDARCVSELLFGETAQVVGEAANGFLEIAGTHDQYTGYLRAEHLTTSTIAHTHRVITRATLVFPEPDIKRQPVMRLPFGARVCVTTTDDNKIWAQDPTGWIRLEHLAPSTLVPTSSPVELAQFHFIGAPYLWGGRSPDGCDCSGLVQLVHAACGLSLPRDSGDQENALTHRIDPDNRRSGDLVFWPGHVALLVERDTVRHANAHSLSVVDEALSAVCERAGKISSIRRPDLTISS